MAKPTLVKTKWAVEGRDWFNGSGGSERRIVSFIVGVITVGRAVLLAVLVEQLHAVTRPDAIAQVIKQFDNGEGLRRRPVGRILREMVSGRPV